MGVSWSFRLLQRDRWGEFPKGYPAVIGRLKILTQSRQGAKTQGRLPEIRAAYRHAVAERYRFFSYGDAMLVTPQAAARSGGTHAV
jgi:hypothetical protein